MNTAKTLNAPLVLLPIEILETIIFEGHFTHLKSVRDFFGTKGFLRIFHGFFLKTKGFLLKVYEIFGSEMPLDYFHENHSVNQELRSWLIVDD